MTETIYILTNPYLSDFIKIGRTKNLEERLKCLNTAVPAPFEVYYACTVKNPRKVEKHVHDAFQEKRVNQKREFFEMNPENAVSALKLVEIENVTPKKDLVETKEDENSLEIARKRSQYFSFKLVKIRKGAVLTFVRDDTIQAIVVDEKNIECEDKITSLSKAAKRLLKRGHNINWKTVRGPNFWKYKNETLTDRKIRLENEKYGE